MFALGHGTLIRECEQRVHRALDDDEFCLAMEPYFPAPETAVPDSSSSPASPTLSYFRSLLLYMLAEHRSELPTMFGRYKYSEHASSSDTFATLGVPSAPFGTDARARFTRDSTDAGSGVSGMSASVALPDTINWRAPYLDCRAATYAVSLHTAPSQPTAAAIQDELCFISDRTDEQTPADAFGSASHTATTPPGTAMAARFRRMAAILAAGRDVIKRLIFEDFDFGDLRGLAAGHLGPSLGAMTRLCSVKFISNHDRAGRTIEVTRLLLERCPPTVTSLWIRHTKPLASQTPSAPAPTQGAEGTPSELTRADIPDTPDPASVLSRVKRALASELSRMQRAAKVSPLREVVLEGSCFPRLPATVTTLHLQPFWNIKGPQDTVAPLGGRPYDYAPHLVETIRSCPYLASLTVTCHTHPVPIELFDAVGSTLSRLESLTLIGVNLPPEMPPDVRHPVARCIGNLRNLRHLAVISCFNMSEEPVCQIIDAIYATQPPPPLTALTISGAVSGRKVLAALRRHWGGSGGGGGGGGSGQGLEGPLDTFGTPSPPKLTSLTLRFEGSRDKEALALAEVVAMVPTVEVVDLGTHYLTRQITVARAIASRLARYRHLRTLSISFSLNYDPDKIYAALLDGLQPLLSLTALRTNRFFTSVTHRNIGHVLGVKRELVEALERFMPARVERANRSRAAWELVLRGIALAQERRVGGGGGDGGGGASFLPLLNGIAAHLPPRAARSITTFLEHGDQDVELLTMS
jgi:hypothetical protein